MDTFCVKLELPCCLTGTSIPVLFLDSIQKKQEIAIEKPDAHVSVGNTVLLVLCWQVKSGIITFGGAFDFLVCWNRFQITQPVLHACTAFSVTEVAEAVELLVYI